MSRTCPYIMGKLMTLLFLLKQIYYYCKRLACGTMNTYRVRQTKCIGLIKLSTAVAAAIYSTFDGTFRVLWRFYDRRYRAWGNCKVPSKVPQLAGAAAVLHYMMRPTWLVRESVCVYTNASYPLWLHLGETQQVKYPSLVSNTSSPNVWWLHGYLLFAGVRDGTCGTYVYPDGNTTARTCNIHAWCPVEFDQTPL